MRLVFLSPRVLTLVSLRTTTLFSSPLILTRSRSLPFPSRPEGTIQSCLDEVCFWPGSAVPFPPSTPDVVKYSGHVVPPPPAEQLLDENHPAVNRNSGIAIASLLLRTFGVPHRHLVGWFVRRGRE